MWRPRWSARASTFRLLIGGATTSRVHTAVKIHPRYRAAQTVHVNDASRAVGVVGALLSPETRASYVETVRAEYRKVAERMRAAKLDKTRLPLAKARANAMKIDWSGYRPTEPKFFGARVIEAHDLADLARYIDWTPFFQTWELKGRYPAILEDEKQGAAARALFADAQAMLKRIIAEKWFAPKAVVGFWPAGAEGDDICLFDDEARERSSRPSSRCASSSPSATGRPNVALADFVAPPGAARRLYRRLRRDRRASRRTTIAKRFARANDDYSSILVKALADRFAEAFAERCTRACGASSGAMRRTRRCARGADRGELSRHPPGARAIPPSPTIRKRRRCSRCSTPRR